MIQNGSQYGRYEKEKLHIGGTILIKKNFELLSVHIQMFFESTWVFQSRLHHLKWQPCKTASAKKKKASC